MPLQAFRANYLIRTVYSITGEPQQHNLDHPNMAYCLRI